MKKFCSKIISCFLLLNSQMLFAQKMSNKEASQLLTKAVSCLKTNDTSAFVNLWYLDNSGRPYDNSPFTKKDILAEFNELKIFLDTALSKNLNFDDVEIKDEKDVSKHSENKFSSNKILAWYLYDAKRKYYKGFGVRTVYVNQQWYFRYTVQYSISNR